MAWKTFTLAIKIPFSTSLPRWRRGFLMKLEELEVLEVIEELEVLEILDKTRNSRNSRKIMPAKKNNKKSPPEDFSSGGLHLSFLLRDWKKAVTYSPALHCSTIGASGLNFSVRNGKRWNPAAVATWYGGHLLQTSSFEWRIKNEESFWIKN